MVVGAPDKDNGEVYMFTLQGETWTEDKILTASDLSLGNYLGWSVAISGYTLLVGAPYKDGRRGAAYVFVFEVYGSWDEGTEIVSINGIASGDEFGRWVALSGDRALIGDIGSDEKENGKSAVGEAYIFHRMNGVWQEGSKLVPSYGESYDHIGYDVALSGDTAIIGSPYDG